MEIVVNTRSVQLTRRTAAQALLFAELQKNAPPMQQVKIKGRPVVYNFKGTMGIAIGVVIVVLLIGVVLTIFKIGKTKKNKSCEIFY